MTASIDLFATPSNRNQTDHELLEIEYADLNYLSLSNDSNSEFLQIHLSSESHGEILISIYNSNNEKVVKKCLVVSPGMSFHELNIENLHPDEYTVKVVNRRKSLKMNFTKLS